MRPVLFASICVLVSIPLTACGNPETVSQTAPAAEDAAPTPQTTAALGEKVFPDMPAPTPFTRAYVMTENAAGTIRVFGKESSDDTDLYESRMQPDGSWSEPEKLDWPKRLANAYPHFSPFDGMMYFASDRELPYREGSTDLNIWRIANEDGVWGEAEALPEPVNTGAKETSSAMDASGRLYFVSNHPRGMGGQDIYYAEQSGDTGAWTVMFMPPTVNSTRVDDHIALMPDNRTLVFYTHTEPKLGVVDLKAVTLEDDGNWIGPYNIGPEINTADIDFGPGVFS